MEFNDKQLAFVVEWFDPHPQIVKRYVLRYHCRTNEVEMRELGTSKLFLKRTKVELSESDFFVGANCRLLSRDLKFVEYFDDQTQQLLETCDERTVCVLPPTLYESLGDVVMLIEKAGFTLVELQSTCFGDVKDVEAAAEFINVDPNEFVRRPEPLVTMSFRGANAIAAVNELVRSSSFAGLGLSSPSNADDLEALMNFFTKRQSRSPATFEECTCCVIKPHAIKERLVGAIFNDILSRGFVLSAVSMFQLERAAAAEFLEVYDGVVPEYSDMVDEMCSGSVVALEVRLRPDSLCVGDTGRQEEIVEKFRAHAGPWDVNMAKELYSDTIRGRFGHNRILNAIHCTDLPKDGIIEVEYFFKVLGGSNYIDGWK